MKQLAILLCILIPQITTLAQEAKPIPVVLSTIAAKAPFYPSRTSTILSTATDLQGIPAELKEYKIKELAFGPSNDKLFILYGITRDEKRMILFDANFDRSFSNEQVYLFNKDVSYKKEKEKAVTDTTRAVEIYLPNAPAIFLKPVLFNCCRNYNNPLDSTWHLFVETSYHREGVFEIEGQQFKLAVSASNTPYFRTDYAEAFLLPGNKNFEAESNSNESYSFKRPIILSNREFVLDSLSLFGDTAWVLYNGYKEGAQGSREGLYALNIQTKTISGLAFNLQEHKGSYVLLDFWGTWCGPCIALIPRVKRLNQTYKAKGLKIVSIAFDKKESYPKLLKMLKAKKMDWTNIYDNQGASNSITNQYEVNCFPTSVLIDPNGKIIFRSCGEDDFEVLEKKIKETLN